MRSDKGSVKSFTNIEIGVNQVKKLNFNKLLTILTIFLVMGQSIFPSVEVLADEIQNARQEIVKKEEAIEESTEQSSATNEEVTDQKPPLQEQSAQSTENETNQTNAPPVPHTHPAPLIDVTEINLAPTNGGVTTSGEQIIYHNVGNVSPMGRAVGNGTTYLGKYYGGYQTSTAYITIGTEVAWCIEPHKPAPVNIQYAEEVYTDEGIYNILYYANEWGWNKANSNYVDVYVALNVYLGAPNFADHPAKLADPNVARLLEKARVKDAPRGIFGFNKTAQNATVKNGQQETEWYTPTTDSKNITYNITVPDNVKAVTSDGRTLSKGVHTLAQNISFKLVAPLNYGGTVKFDVPTNLRPKSALKFIPHDGTSQKLTKAGTVRDPLTLKNLSATFVKRSGNLNIQKVDAETGAALAGAEFKIDYDGKTMNATGNAEGLAAINDLLDGTTGTVQEIKAPNGYILNETPQEFKIEAGKVTTITLKNTLARQDIRLIKKDKVTGAELQGVEFELQKQEGAQFVPVSKHITGKGGLIEVKGLTVGKYQFVETKALPGYILSKTPIEFEVTVDTHGQLIELTVDNNRKPITIATKAQFNNGAQLYDPLAKVMVKESVILDGLVPGSEYTLDIKGYQLTSTEIYEKVVKTHIFVATAEKMTLDFEFELDGKELKGNGIVFTETLSFQDKIVSRHEDLENKTQTVEFTNPEIETLAQFENGSHLYDPLSKVPVTETTKLTGLIPGQEYTLDVAGYRLSTGEAFEGVTDQKVFVADATEMTFTFEFELNGKDLIGDGIVFTERLSTENEEIATHEDLENKEQTVEFTNPKIETLAQFENGAHLYDPLAKVPVKETTKLTGLIPGQEYTLDVQGHRLSSGETYEGTTDQKVFVAESEEMEFTFEFELNGKDLIGDGIVFTEHLSTQDEEIAEHTDLENEKQTVKFTQPTIKTKATGKDGSQLLAALSQVPVIEETVMTDLIPGVTYTLKVQGYRLSTQTPYEKTKLTKTFVADAETMTFKFEFMLDGRELAQDGIVFTETLHTQDEEIAEHKDLKNQLQTVRFKAIPDVPTLPQTGERAASLAVIVGLSLMMLTVFMYHFKKEQEI